MSTADHLTEHQFAAYLDGGLEPEERRRAAAHLDACPECRGELIELARIASTYPPTAVLPRRMKRRWWLPAAAALAASLAGIALYRTVANRSPEETLRAPVVTDEAVPRIDVVEPRDGASVPETQVVFIWRARSADSYRIFLLAEDGEPIWTLETDDTSATLPVEIALAHGRTYFWRVDALADGVSATSGVQRLQVPR